MTTLILAAATLWLVVIPAAITLWLRYDRSQDEAWEAERPERPELSQRRPSDLSSGVGWAERVDFDAWEKEMSA